MAAFAAPIRRKGDGAVLGCLSIAGPGVRVTPARMEDLKTALFEAADEIGAAAEASFFFNRNRAAIAPDQERR